MSDFRRILRRVLAREFYRLHSGFFMVVIALTFGFMSKIEHLALAQYFISGFPLILVPIGAWSVYLLKILNFNREQLTLPENLFLFEAGLLKRASRFMGCLFVIVIEFLPALAYGLFLGLVAITRHQDHAVTEIATAETALVLSGTLALSTRLSRKPCQPSIGRFGKFLSCRITRPLPFIEFEWVARNHPLLLAGTKVFASLLLFGVCRLYAAEVYDLRLLGMATTVAFGADFILIQLLQRLTCSDSLLLRNMPISRLQRMADFGLVFLTLCIPESLTLLRYFPAVLHKSDFPLILFFGWSIGILFFALQFVGSMTGTSFKHFLFGSIIFWIVLILFKLPIVLLSLLNSAIALIVFYRNYYQFEAGTVAEELGIE